MSTQTLNTFVKKQPVVVAAVAASILLIAAFYFRHSDIPDLETLLESRKSDGQRIETNISFGKQLPEQLEAVTAANVQSVGRLINASDLAKNLQYFYKIEADTGVKLTDVHPVMQSAAAKAASKSLYPAIGYGLSAQGDYKKVIAFLRKLETGTHFSRVLSSSFSGTNESANVTLTLSVELLGQP